MILAFDLVGWGTLTLAAVTAVMVVATFLVSKQTAKLASVAEKELEASHLILKASLEQVAASQAQAAASQAQAGASQEQVWASQAQADAAREALSLSVRPLLVPANGTEDDRTGARDFEANGFALNAKAPAVAMWSSGGDPSGVEVQWVIVKIRNIGNGPAMVNSRPDGLFLRTMLGRDVPGTATSLVVAAGDFAYLAFADTTSFDEPNSLASMLSLAEQSPSYPQTLTVVVRYADVGRERWALSHLRFHPRNQNRLDLVSVEFEDAP